MEIPTPKFKIGQTVYFPWTTNKDKVIPARECDPSVHLKTEDLGDGRKLICSNCDGRGKIGFERVIRYGEKVIHVIKFRIGYMRISFGEKVPTEIEYYSDDYTEPTDYDSLDGKGWRLTEDFGFYETEQEAEEAAQRLRSNV